ncbi:glycoside hydrolase family 9 protein [Microtetraspora malaysiensis]|uniref:glycoside hydrolase family 9 protein n=1 Tax=Microtetraspora malaysiensis TaxID=161358 RepID=UPI003D9008FB
MPCRPGVCDYILDVPGGWYDAGDHGKYVVNGGISAAQLMASSSVRRTRPPPRPPAASTSPRAATRCPTSSTRPAGSRSSWSTSQP